MLSRTQLSLFVYPGIVAISVVTLRNASRCRTDLLRSTKSPACDSLLQLLQAPDEQYGEAMAYLILGGFSRGGGDGGVDEAAPASAGALRVVPAFTQVGWVMLTAP